ncbi:hypothetical protein R5R35_009602 [Gryllus longicercus]|uniref:Uncharacterized protein n=1 Tax=Gryllus longicercus TaxID=2509291 RepID=A0AAN9VFZ0_9ORTH
MHRRPRQPSLSAPSTNGVASDPAALRALLARSLAPGVCRELPPRTVSRLSPLGTVCLLTRAVLSAHCRAVSTLLSILTLFSLQAQPLVLPFYVASTLRFSPFCPLAGFSC